MNFQNNPSSRYKITVPPIYHNILPRNNISRIIDNAPLNTAVCIIAPYGCGKTLSVVSWLRENGRQAAWIDLSQNDNSEDILLNYLTSAMLSFIPEQYGDFLTDHEYLKDPQAFLREAVFQASQNDREKTLIIDNLHFIHDVELFRFIKNFIYSLLGTWRVILMSRAELSPVFNDLMLKGHICLITPTELSFSPAEMADYFNMNGCSVSQSDIQQMRNDTEGWPAALNVILTVSRGGPIGYREASRDYVIGFFETEIWEGLSENIKDFLLKTSILEKLTPSICHAVTGIGATLPLLKWLLLNGLFISKLDEKDSYCYHRVFKDFLLYKLSLSDIDERELYMKVAWWHYERDEIDQSFPYFFKAGDLYGLSQVLKIINPANMGVDGFLELTSCITTLNIFDLKNYPVIVARMALIQYLMGNVAEMQALYKTFIEWIDPGVLQISPEEYAEYIWEAGWLSYLNPAENLKNNKTHEKWANYKEFVPHLGKLHLDRSAVVRFYPSMLRGVRDYSTTVDDLEPFYERVEKTGINPIHDKRALLEMELMLAEYVYELENFPKSYEIVRRIMPEADEMPHADFFFICTSLLVKLMRVSLNYKEIDEITERLEAMIMHKEDFFMLPNFHAFQLSNRLAAGHTGLTEVFEEENKGCEDKPYFYLLYRHIVFVRGLLSTGDYNRAILMLGNLEMLCQKYDRTMDLLEVNILRSIALYGLGYEDDACQRLIEALTGAERYGYIRIFSDNAESIWPVLQLARKKMSGKYIQSIIISCKKSLAYTGGNKPEKKYSHIELTKAELKMLKSLQAGMSYEEIAHDSNIRMSTVKSRVHTIYSKLGVDNKTSAVIAAISMGILQP